MSNPEQVKLFGQQLFSIYTGAILTKMIDLGYRTGLFEASRHGPATSETLSERAGLHERYVREWLGAMTTSGIYHYDPDSRQYFLPPEHATLLTGSSMTNLSPTSRIINHLGGKVPMLAERFRDGRGIPYSEYGAEFFHSMDDLWHRIYDAQLIDGFLGKFPELITALKTGIRVLDLGCGTGHAVNLLASAYSRSTFVGYDLAEDAIHLAEDEAHGMGLTNVTFEVMDAAHFSTRPPFDLILAFDTIHDLSAPEAVLNRIREALSAGGAFLMIEFRFNSTVDGNIGNPFAPFYYGISLLHCTPVSLAHGGPGLGAVWGEQTARQMLSDAGFSQITVTDSPRPQNYMFLCRP